MTEGLIGGEGFAVDASIVKADASRLHSLPGDESIDLLGNPATSTRAVREYLTALDENSSTSTLPKSISPTDPAARLTGAPGGPAFYAYSTNYLIDLHAAIIIDVEATPAHRTAEVDSTRMMVDRVEDKFDMKPVRLVGDTAYGSTALLGWMVNDKNIAPHVPVFDKSERTDGTFGRSDFTVDAENNRYICPSGNYLKPAWRSKQKNPFRYRASLYDCQPCPLKTQCCPNVDIRKIDRSPHEAARDVARAIARTSAYQQSRKDRKEVEVLFAHLKYVS